MKKDIDGLISILANGDKAKDVSEEKQVSLSEQAPDGLTIEYLRTQIDRLKEEIEGLKQDREQRKIFSYVIFGFMCVYMVAVLVAVYLKGFCCMDFSDSVMITLLTTSLANVIGIFNFVAKYLFHTKN